MHKQNKMNDNTHKQYCSEKSASYTIIVHTGSLNAVNNWDKSGNLSQSCCMYCCHIEKLQEQHWVITGKALHCRAETVGFRHGCHTSFANPSSDKFSYMYFPVAKHNVQHNVIITFIIPVTCCLLECEMFQTLNIL